MQALHVAAGRCHVTHKPAILVHSPVQTMSSALATVPCVKVLNTMVVPILLAANSKSGESRLQKCAGFHNIVTDSSAASVKHGMP